MRGQSWATSCHARINIFLQNMFNLILGFTLGVWARYFDFYKVNDI